MARTRRYQGGDDSDDSEVEGPPNNERNDPSDDEEPEDPEGPDDPEDPENPEEDSEEDPEDPENPEDPELSDDDASGLGDGPGALTPGQAMRGTLDYENNKSHNYLFRNATLKLDENLYDCTPDQFFPFMKNLEVRANNYGWNSELDGILWLNRKGGVRINLLDSYGSISLGRITRHEKTYWNNGFRASQDDRMLYECLMASLSPAGKSKVNIHSEKYLLKSGNERIPSGLCLLKVIVSESYLDSNATTSMIREQLSNLDLFMPTCGNDITRFNNHVKMLLQALHARNERTLDLLTYLFKAYAVCNDKEFTKFINDLQTDHDMGTKRLDAQELMSFAERKFKIMKTLGKWEAPSQVDEKIMALQARLSVMQKDLDRAKSKRKKGGGDNQDEPKNKKHKKSDRPEWFKHPPKEGKMHETKKWNGIEWHYCCKETGGNCGGIWRAHLPSKCKTDPNKKSGGKFKKRGGGDKRPSVELKAKQAVLDEEALLGGGYMSVDE